MSNFKFFGETHRRYAHRWLMVVPFIWQIALLPFVNSAQVRVFSLPLPMVWQMAGILVATAVIAFVYWRDERQEARFGMGEDVAQESAS